MAGKDPLEGGGSRESMRYDTCESRRRADSRFGGKCLNMPGLVKKLSSRYSSCVMPNSRIPDGLSMAAEGSCYLQEGVAKLPVLSPFRPLVVPLRLQDQAYLELFP